MEPDEVALVGVGEQSDGKGEASQRLSSVSSTMSAVSDGAKFGGATVSNNGEAGLVDPGEDGEDTTDITEIGETSLERIIGEPGMVDPGEDG